MATYSFRRNLFKTDVGASMTFNIERCNDAEELKELIEYGGGLVSEEEGPYTVILSSSKDDCDTVGQKDVFKPLYIFKSCVRNHTLPLKSFRLNEISKFGDDFDPNEVLHQRKTWRDAERWLKDGMNESVDNPQEIEDTGLNDSQNTEYTGFIMIGDVVPLVVLRRIDLPPGQTSINLKEDDSQLQNKSPSVISISSSDDSIEVCEEQEVQRRNNYTQEEREEMVLYLVKHEAYTKLSQQSMWRKMSRKFPRHTWQSLKEHFKKKIMPYIWGYDLPEDIVDKFRSGIHTELNQKRERRVEEFDLSYRPIKISDSEDEVENPRRKKKRKISKVKYEQQRRTSMEISSNDAEDMSLEERKHSNKSRLQKRLQETEASKSSDSETDGPTSVRNVTSRKKGLVIETSSENGSTNDQGKSTSLHRKQLTKEDNKASPICQKKEASILDSSDSENQIVSSQSGKSTNEEDIPNLESSDNTDIANIQSTPPKNNRLNRSKTSGMKKSNVQFSQDSNNSSLLNNSKQTENFWSNESKTDSLFVEYSSGKLSGEYSNLMHSGFSNKSQSAENTAFDENFENDIEDFDICNDDGGHQRETLDSSNIKAVKGIRPLQAVKPHSGSTCSVVLTAAKSTSSSNLNAAQTSGNNEVKDASMQFVCADPVVTEGCSQTDPVALRPLLVHSPERQSSSHGNSAPVTRQSSKENKTSPASAPVTRQSSKENKTSPALSDQPSQESKEPSAFIIRNPAYKTRRSSEGNKKSLATLSSLKESKSSSGVIGTSLTPKKDDVKSKSPQKIHISPECSSKLKDKPSSSPSSSSNNRLTGESEIITRSKSPQKIHISPGCSSELRDKASSHLLREDRFSSSLSDRLTRQSERRTQSKSEFSSKDSQKYQHPREKKTP